MGILFAVTVAVAAASIIYFNVFVAEFLPLATGQFSGPWTKSILLLEWAVPLTLVIIELGTASWALAGGVQRERARKRVR
jgi:hypothetical protein